MPFQNLLGGVGLAVGLDSLDANFHEILAMTLELFVLLFALQVEDENLVAAAFANDLGCDLCVGRLGDGAGFTGDSEYVAELNGCAGRIALGGSRSRSSKHLPV